MLKANQISHQSTASNGSNISKRVIEAAFLDWIYGYSLRDLEDKYGVSRASFSLYFRKYFGKDYAYHRRVKGTERIIKEYLKPDNKSLNKKQKEEVRQWYEDNQQFLWDYDLANKDQQLYDSREINNLTNYQTSGGLYDYRHIFENTLDADIQWEDRFRGS